MGAAQASPPSEPPLTSIEMGAGHGELQCPTPDLRPQTDGPSLVALPAGPLVARILPQRQGFPAGPPAIRLNGPARQALLQRFLL